MRIIAAVLLPLALGLSACDTMYDEPYGPAGYPPAPYPAPYPEPYPAPGYPAPAPGEYRAVGTEPFWDLTIGRDLVFTDRGTGLAITQPTPQVIVGIAGEIYRTPRLDVNIVHGRCTDGMSDRTYPDSVQVHADGRLYRGCGGPSDALAPVPPVGTGIAPPLDRTRWSVVAINNRPVPPEGEYSMEFDNGRLSARFGCNNMSGNYTQTGSTIDAGTIIGTQMACGDMSWETQGTAVLSKVMQVNALAPDRITLTSSAGSIELVRR